LRRFLFDGVLKPGAALVFLLGFGGVWVFVAFESVTVSLERTAEGRVNGTLARSHFLGAYQTATPLRGVTQARLATRRSTGPKGVLGAAVVIEAASGPAGFGFGNVDDERKREMVRELDRFLRDDRTGRFTAEFRLRHIGKWFGVPFFVLGLVGLVTWPWTIAQAWGRRRPPADPRMAA
jgi:hypothetical protein